MSFATLLVEVRDHAGIVTFNRPERMNAVTSVVEAELHDALRMLDADRRVRVIILAGQGRAFCAGMDMDELKNLPAGDIFEPAKMRPFDTGTSADFQGRYSYFPSIAKPIIAAVNGAAAGLGLIFALYSDIRLVGKQAVFVTAFSQRGLIAEHGSAWILSRVVGMPMTMDMLLSSRRIDAQEALRIGLAHRLVESDDFLGGVLDYAATLARSVSPRSMRVMKRQIWQAQTQTLAQALTLANLEMVDSINSPDFREGVAHFLERRPPRFEQ